MKKFIISALFALLAFTGIHAQTSDSSSTTKTMHKTHTAMKGTHKAGHGTMHHKTTTTKQKNTTSGGAATTPQQKPVATTTPSATTTASTKTARSTKGAHYTVSNGKKTFVKSPHSK